MKTPLPVPPVDLARIKQLSMNALLRARAMVYAVPVSGQSGEFTLSADRVALDKAGLPREAAENYAAAVNGEAELARAMLTVIAELERLRDRLEALRDQAIGDHSSPHAASSGLRHG